jgi:hypothetical protein
MYYIYIHTKIVAILLSFFLFYFMFEAKAIFFNLK